MVPRRIVAVALPVALALVISACGSPGAPPSTPAAGDGLAGSPTAAEGAGGAGLGKAIQLSFDPCTLITEAEAKATLDVDVTKLSTDNGGGGACDYVGVGSPSHLLASLPSSADCNLLFLQIDNGLFGDVQKKIDGIGDGGMLVAGQGNLQIAVHRGCFEIDAATADGPLPDAKMLDLARTAVSRVP